MINSVNNKPIHLQNKPTFSKVVDQISMKVDNQKRNLPLSQREDIPQELKQFAEDQEAIFANQMIKEMRKTIQQDSPDGPAQNYYKSILDDERSKIMAKQGIGLKDVILDQIVPQHLKNKITPNNLESNKHKVTMYQQAKAMEPSPQETNNE